MLKAILEGKAGRVEIEAISENLSWRDLFRKREDLLTAVFFSRLRYLSLEGQQAILSLLIDQDLSLLGELIDVIFWPKLKGLDGRSHVEPDVVLTFDHSLILIEVKPPFGGAQKENQWHDEVKSLIRQEEIEVPKQFHFLALGRNVSDSQEAAGRLLDSYSDDGLVSVQLREWKAVWQGVHRLADVAEGSDKAIYHDWIEAFTLFGLIMPPLPFEDMKRLNNVSKNEWKSLMRALEIPAEKEISGAFEWEQLVGKSKICIGDLIWQ